jgi:hypothetical protein
MEDVNKDEVPPGPIPNYVSFIVTLAKARECAVKAGACINESVASSEAERKNLIALAKDLLKESLSDSSRLEDYLNRKQGK